MVALPDRFLELLADTFFLIAIKLPPLPALSLVSRELDVRFERRCELLPLALCLFMNFSAVTTGLMGGGFALAAILFLSLSYFNYFSSEPKRFPDFAGAGAGVAKF